MNAIVKVTFRSFLLGSGLVLLTSGCVTNDVQSISLMDEIENQISMPSGAFELQKYGRSYAFSDDGNVIGHYMIPIPQMSADESCSKLTIDLELVDCEPEALDEMKDYIENQVKAGERRWLGDFRQLPIQDDGGCSFIEIKYVQTTKKFSSIKCNERF